MMKYLINKLIFRSGPKIRIYFFTIYNRLKFNMMGAVTGRNLKVLGRVYLQIEKGGRLNIGDNFTFTSGDGINPLSIS